MVCELLCAGNVIVALPALTVMAVGANPNMVSYISMTESAVIAASEKV